MVEPEPEPAPAEWQGKVQNLAWRFKVPQSAALAAMERSGGHAGKAARILRAQSAGPSTGDAVLAAASERAAAAAAARAATPPRPSTPPGAAAGGPAPDGQAAMVARVRQEVEAKAQAQVEAAAAEAAAGPGAAAALGPTSDTAGRLAADRSAREALGATVAALQEALADAQAAAAAAASTDEFGTAGAVERADDALATLEVVVRAQRSQLAGCVPGAAQAVAVGVAEPTFEELWQARSELVTLSADCPEQREYFDELLEEVWASIAEVVSSGRRSDSWASAAPQLVQTLAQGLQAHGLLNEAIAAHSCVRDDSLSILFVLLQSR